MAQLSVNDPTAGLSGNIPESQVTNLVSDLAAKQPNISLTTTGTSGAATLVSNTLNIPQYSAGGGGDASTNTATSVDSEVALFSGTAGKTLKRATGSGLAKLTAGVLSTATSGTDYAPGTAGNTTGIVKSTTTTGALTTAVAADFPTLNQNTTGSAASFTGSLVGDVTGTQGATVVGKVNGVAISAGAATLAAGLNGATTRTATATLAAGEVTVFTGSTAAQTLTLPVTPQASSLNTITNIASVTVTLAAGAGNTINSNGTVGSITIPVGGSYTLVFIGTVWYVTNNDQLAVTGTGSTVLATSPALTTPAIGSAGATYAGSTSGTVTLKASSVASGTMTIPSGTDTLVSLTGTQTLTGKTLTTPIISSISNTGTLTLPTSTDTLVGKATTDILTNKELTNPLITGGAGAPATPAAGAAKFYAIGTSNLKPGWINEAGNSERIISTTGPISASITANFTTVSTTQVIVTGLSATITVPAGRTVKISACGPYFYNSAANYSEIGVWRGTVGTGTQIGWYGSNGTNPRGWHVFTLDTPTAGSTTYNIGCSVTAGTGTVEASAVRPCWILVELL